MLSTRHKGNGISGNPAEALSQQADLVGLWSSVAVGALFSGNKRDLQQYIAHLQRATEVGGLLSGGSTEVRARLPLALMHDVLGQTEQAYNVLDLSRPQVEGQGNALESMSMNSLFPILAGGCPQKFIDFFFTLVGKGSQNFLATPEQIHAQRAMNIFYEVYFAVLKMPFASGEGNEDNLEAMVRACHRNLSLGEVDTKQRPEDYSPIVYFIVQDKLFLLELCCLGEVSNALGRCKRLPALLREHSYLLHISYIRIKVCSMVYTCWVAGDRETYQSFAAIWNTQACVAADCMLLPPFEEYNPDLQCDHYYCQMWQPKFQLAITMMALPSSSDNSVLKNCAPGLDNGGNHGLVVKHCESYVNTGI